MGRSAPLRAAGGRRRVTALCAGMVLATAGAASAARAGVIRVTLEVPAPVVLDTQGIETVLVTRLIVDEDVADFDLNRELVTLLRRELRKQTVLDVLDVDPPSLPEQPLPELLANTGFWRRMASAHGADMVIAGTTGFRVGDRSGFVQRDEISPVTGQRIRRTRFVDREAFTLDLNLFFIRGTTGQLSYEDHFSTEETLNGTANDRLTGLFSLFERLEDDIVGIIVPRARTVQRNLFTD